MAGSQCQLPSSISMRGPLSVALRWHLTRSYPSGPRRAPCAPQTRRSSPAPGTYGSGEQVCDKCQRSCQAPTAASVLLHTKAHLARKERQRDRRKDGQHLPPHPQPLLPLLGWPPITSPSDSSPPCSQSLAPSPGPEFCLLFSEFHHYLTTFGLSGCFICVQKLIS